MDGDVARYEVPGARMAHSPLLVLSDDLEGYGLAESAPEMTWGLVRLMMDPDADAGLSADLLGAGVGPAEALLSAGLQMLWAADQRGEDLAETQRALLLAHQPLLGDEAAAVEHAHIATAVLDRIDVLLRAVVDLGASGPNLLRGVVTVLRDAGALPDAEAVLLDLAVESTRDLAVESAGEEAAPSASAAAGDATEPDLELVPALLPALVTP